MALIITRKNGETLHVGKDIVITVYTDTRTPVL